jgi:hypothetical protein
MLLVYGYRLVVTLLLIISRFYGKLGQRAGTAPPHSCNGACRMTAPVFGILHTVARFKIIESTDESDDGHPIGVELYDRVLIS